MRTSVIGLSVVAAVAMAVPACSEEQRRDVEGAAIRVVIQDRAEDVLSDNDIELEGDLDCSADIADDGTVTGSCTGTDVDGNGVEATLDGTVDVDEATCGGTFVVSVAGQTLDEQPDFDCLDG